MDTPQSGGAAQARVSNSRISVSLDHRDRARAKRPIWVWPAFALLVIASWEWLFWIDYSASDQYIVEALTVPLAIVVGGGIGWCYFLYFIRSLGSYSCRFEVTHDSIDWILPDGRTVSGRWANLEYVSAENRLLYFADGIKIPLKFGPGRHGEIPSATMQAIAAMSGDGSILSRALSEISSIAIPNRTRFDRVRLIIVGVALAMIPMAFMLYLLFKGISNWVAMCLGIILFAGPVAYLATKHILKATKIERKYGPPKNHPNVLWHRQF